MSEVNGKMKDFFLKNWTKLITGVVFLISAFIGLKMTVADNTLKINEAIPKIALLEKEQLLQQGVNTVMLEKLRVISEEQKEMRSDVKELLRRNPDPSETEVRFWLAGNLCRCTGYDKIIRSVLVAAEEMRGS